MDEETKQLLETMRQESAVARAENAAAHADTRRQFEIGAEGLRDSIKLVAEGVSTNTQRIERLESEMKEEFAEVRSMIKLSHGQLDRRVRLLEHK